MDPTSTDRRYCPLPLAQKLSTLNFYAILEIKQNHPQIKERFQKPLKNRIFLHAIVCPGLLKPGTAPCEKNPKSTKKMRIYALEICYFLLEKVADHSAQFLMDSKGCTSNLKSKQVFDRFCNWIRRYLVERSMPVKKSTRAIWRLIRRLGPSKEAKRKNK